MAKASSWAGPAVGGTFLAGLLGGVARSTHPYPQPGATPEQIEGYFTQPSRAPWISITGQYLSAAALAVWTSRVAGLGRGSVGTRAAALVGGATATTALITAASRAATLADGSAKTPEQRIQVHRTVFTAGGVVHGVGFGLLLAALGAAGRQSGQLSPPLANAATLTAVPNLLTPLYFRWPALVWLIPGGRMPGLIVTALAGARLARRSPK
jgi:hypothetical protein